MSCAIQTPIEKMTEKKVTAHGNTILGAAKAFLNRYRHKALVDSPVIPRVAISNVRHGVNGSLIFAGWALTASERWLLNLRDQDGNPVNGTLTLHLPRADVAANFPQYFNANAGWEFEVAARTFAKLSHLSAELYSVSGTVNVTFEIDTNDIKPAIKVISNKLPAKVGVSSVEIDEPAREAVIRGWALPASDHWFLTLTNQTGKIINGRLTKGIHRADIAHGNPSYINENAGWEFRLSVRELDKIEQLIAELVTDTQSVKTQRLIDELPRKSIGALNPPRISISTARIKYEDETLVVTGWRLNPADEELIVITNEKGAVIQGRFTFDLPRMDVAAQHPGYFDSVPGWEFIAKVKPSAAPESIAAELITPSGRVKTAKPVDLGSNVVRQTKTIASLIDLAVFDPNRRQLIAQGTLDSATGINKLEISSSAGRRFSQAHIQRLPDKDGRRRWQFQAPCSGLEDSETLIAKLAGKSIETSLVIDIKETDSFKKLSKAASLSRTEIHALDDNSLAVLKKAENLRDTLYTEAQALTPIVGTVVYFPPFAHEDDLTNHFHRAAWYLTGAQTSAEQVIMGLQAPDLKVGLKPDHFTDPHAGTENIELVEAGATYCESLCTAQLILTWQAIPAADMARLRKVAPTAQILSVGTDDIESTEYGNYCRAQWMLLGKAERNELLQQSHIKFRERLDHMRAEGKEASVVFGTGPSIDKAFDYDFSKCLTIVCNTAVADDDLLDHIQPAFICAGDVVSHFGVSAYAERFRADLVRALKERDAYFFTSAAFGFLLSAKYPELNDKIIFCDQRHRGANTDLQAVWALPKLDSTLNIHMLPIAATFSDMVFILGCDGKNPNPDKNEDFWAHSVKTHYHDLVDTGHLAHPTFDLRRQTSTFSRYVDSTEESCQAGEIEGKMYFSLEPSFTPALKARPVPGHFLKNIQDKKQLTRISQANLPAAKKPLRLLIVSKCPPHLFSGGRYHAAMMAEALAQKGHEVVLWMDNKPYWWSYLALNPNHDRIKFWLNDFSCDPSGPFDAVFVIPDSSSDPKAYLAALDCAQFNNAKVILMNYESPNWYNKLSPEPRDPALWAFWYATAAFSDLVLSLAAEGTRYALSYYDNVQPHCQFADAGSSINIYAADVAAARVIEPKNQVICISRFGSFSKHKNIDAVIRVIPPEMAGYTLALVVGTAPLPPSDILETFRSKLARKGVSLKLLHSISDVEKFEEIARSKAMIFQSNFEGLGYPPIEAQYMARPCVAFDLPVLREFSDGNISFIERGNYRAFRQELGLILKEFTREKYAGLKAAITPSATITAFADRLQNIMDNLLKVPELAVDAYDENSFQHAADSIINRKEEAELHISTPAASIPVTADTVDMADVRKYVRAALEKEPEAASIELLEMIASGTEAGSLSASLKKALKPEIWLQPDIFTKAAFTRGATEQMTAAESARALMHSCAWALPQNFDRQAFVSRAVSTCQTYEQTLSLLRRMLRNSDGKLTLKGANLRLATDQDLPVLFDEIILRRSYYFATNNPAPYIIDGGANFGLATYGFLQQFPEAQIVAFEPGRAAITALRENAETNGWHNVTVHQAALAGEEGIAEFNEPLHMSMGGSLTSRLTGGAYKTEAYQVQTLPLSRFIDRPVDLLKLDIEGAEMPVLEEISGHLDQIRRLFIEVHTTENLKALEAVDTVTRKLTQAGFGCYCEPAKANTALNKFTKNGAGSYVVWAIK